MGLGYNIKRLATSPYTKTQQKNLYRSKTSKFQLFNTVKEENFD